uniref:Putative O-antigen ligase n=1 Tax=viral metagenome TaxID=1070528 RepID=A0A6M3IDW5_9ZZZZ
MDLFFIVLTILIAPIVACPLKFFDGYILPQIGVAAIGISIASLFWIYNGSFTISFATIAAFIYFMYLMTSCSWSTVQHNSLRDVPLIFLSVFSYLICSTLFQDKNNIVSVSLAVFSVSMFTSLYAIGQKFLFDPLFPERLRSRKDDYGNSKVEDIHPTFRNKNFIDSRAISTLGNTNFASGFFISTTPFICYLSGEISPYFLLSLIVIIGAIFCTTSKAGKLSLLVFLLSFVIIISGRGYLFDLLFYIAEFPILSNIIIFFTLVTGITYFIILRKENPLKFLSNENDNFNTMLDVENDNQQYWLSTLRYRQKYWKIAFNLIKKRLLQGYGLRTYRKEVYFEQAKINQKDGGKFLRPGYYQTPQPRECHNDFIENFVEGGLVGGILFLSIIFFIICNATIVKDVTLSTKDFFILAGVISALFGMFVEVFFFFPLRLGSSALMFWISLALLQSFTKLEYINININLGIILFLVVMLMAMLWEGVIKPNLGNYFFTKYNFTGIITKKEKYLRKAINYCPRESIFRTHLLIGYLDVFPQEADFHAEILRNHFDGMTPAWSSAFNCGAAKLRRRHFEDAFKFFEESLYFLPSFEDARNRLIQIFPLTPFKRRQITMKQMTEVGIQAVRQGQAEVNALQREISNSQTKFCAVVLNEKLKLNIPIEWAFNPENCQFLSPGEIPADFNVVEIGPTALPLCVKK